MSSIPPRRSAPLRGLTALAMLATLSASAQALTITPNYLGAWTQSQKDAFQFALNEFQAAFADPVTVRLDVQFGATGLGQSDINIVFAVPATYAQVRSALITDNAGPKASANGTASLGLGGSLNQTADPFGNVSYLYTCAQAKALGASTAECGPTDGTITFSNNTAFTFDPNNRGSGGFDFIGVAEHEISEVMGRVTVNGQSVGGLASVDPFDLFNFSGTGAHTLATGPGRYFSINNGTTNLHGYNDAVLHGGDPQDWDSSIANDPFNAITAGDQAHVMNATDLATLDVIGWDLVTAVPEPGRWAPMLAGLSVLGALARRRVRA